MSGLYERLAAAADGDWGQEAAVDLLHRHGRWLPTLDVHGYIAHGPAEDEDPLVVEPYAYIDWDTIAKSLNGTGYRDTHTAALHAASGSEKNVLMLACSLADIGAVNVAYTVTGLDTTNRRLVLHAIAHAMGGRTYADQILPLPGGQ